MVSNWATRTGREKAIARDIAGHTRTPQRASPRECEMRTTAGRGWPAGLLIAVQGQRERDVYG